MKVERRRPLHWFYLAIFALQALLGVIIRPLLTRRGGQPVILYGHKLNGNLLALYHHLQATQSNRFKPVFLTMDRGYHRELKSEGINSQWAATPGCALLLARGTALVSDHGLHSLQLMQPFYQKMGLRFFDVWHGIPFKGFDADDFRLQHRYDEVWVASELHRQLHLERFGFDPARVVVTGYARTDRLVLPKEANDQLRRRFGLPLAGKLILFAPTWAQDVQGRSIYPFGYGDAEFLSALSELAQKQNATILMRSHLNSGDGAGQGYSNIHPLPSGTYPDTESILLVSDMLICDWSSIAFDYLLLDRPTFFLDVPSPFRKGFSLGPEYRFGAVVQALPELLEWVEAALLVPDLYWGAYGDRHRAIRQQVYGDWADGHAAERCVERLASL